MITDDSYTIDPDFAALIGRARNARRQADMLPTEWNLAAAKKAERVVRDSRAHFGALINAQIKR